MSEKTANLTSNTTNTNATLHYKFIYPNNAWETIPVDPCWPFYPTWDQTSPYVYPTTSPYTYPSTTTPYFFTPFYLPPDQTPYYTTNPPKEIPGLTVSEESVMKHLLERWLEQNPNCKVSGQPNTHTCILKPADACLHCITRWYLRK